jgi:N-acetylmuramoyl-L-alanine amidase
MRGFPLRYVGSAGALPAMIALVIVVAAMVTTALESDEKLTASSRCQPPLIKIALDIGHDRSNPGAISATGVTEFSYNLALAHSVIAAIQTAGFNEAFLIGESGVPLSLKERIEIANDHRADLLLSLHHDSVQSRYLSEWTVNAALQRYSDRFHGYSLFISGKNGHARESKKFATALGEALLGEGLTPSLHHAEKIPGENRPLLDARLGLYRFDNLELLKTANMPAALLESGIIVNRTEEQEIRSGSYHNRVVAAVVRAVEEFCGEQGGSLSGR